MRDVTRKVIPERIPIAEFAAGMRLQPTHHEEQLYNALLLVFKPYRATVHAQEPVGPYVADFFISPANIVIEVDGPSHWKQEQRRHDRKRDRFMMQKGLRVMRFQNRQIARNPTACAVRILAECGPLPKRDGAVKVTFCPPGSGLPKYTRSLRNLFWH